MEVDDANQVREQKSGSNPASINKYIPRETYWQIQTAKTGGKLSGAQAMPLACGRTQMFRLPSLGQEIRAVFFVSVFPVLLPAPTERSVLAEQLVANPPGRSPVVIDSSNEADSITTFTFIQYASLLPWLFEERHRSCEPGFLQVLRANHFFSWPHH